MFANRLLLFVLVHFPAKMQRGNEGLQDQTSRLCSVSLSKKCMTLPSKVT